MSNQSPRARGRRRPAICAALAALVSLAFAAGASAHAIVSPAISLSGDLQLFSLAVPTEKEGVTTTKIVLTPPDGFSIDSVAPPPPGWRLAVKSQGSGEEAVVQKLTWSGGRTPTGQDSLFQFLGEPAKAGTYKFAVQQTYSDGSIVNWDGAADSDNPTPTIEAKDSIGGASSVVADIALVVAILALVAAGFALVRRGGAGGSGESGGGRALA